MSLIKRTIVIHKEEPKGILTVIRLGNTVGAKLALNSKPDDGLWLGVRLGAEQTSVPVVSQITEVNLDCEFCASDAVGAMLVDVEGRVFAYGGNAESVSKELIKEARQSLANISANKEIAEEIELPKQNTTAIASEEQTPAVNLNDESEAENGNLEAENAEETAEASSEGDGASDTSADSETQEAIIETANEVTESNAEPPTEYEIMGAEPNEQVAEAQEVVDNTYEQSEAEVVAQETAENEARGDDNDDTVELADGDNPEVTAEATAEADIPQTAEAQTSAENKGADKNPFDIPKAANFYGVIRSRLDEIMTIYPRIKELEELVPDSEWVKVNYDGEDYYIVGRLYSNNMVTHIGYGVPGVEKVKPPKEAAELCDFLPLPSGDGSGYWLMFQRADDGTMSRDF